MKKASLANLIIIIGLLVLCVLTLLAVYATAPNSTGVLLFEENFNALDETKWEHHGVECKEDEGQFHYYKADGVNGYTEDGILYMKPNITEERNRTVRDTSKKCYSCISVQNSNVTCISPLYSAKLQTKNDFEANQGRIEVRAKLPTGDWIKSFIGITKGQNNTEPEEDFGGFNIVKTVGEEVSNGSAKLIIFLGSATNHTIIKSSITTDEFHVYEIEWNTERISFRIDQQDVGGKEFAEESNSTAIRAFKSKRAINQPFYLNVGLDVGEKHSENQLVFTEDEESLNNDSSSNETIFQIDYIRLFKTEL